MKPRTAVATFILNVLDCIVTSDLHDHARDYKKNGRPLTDDQVTRVDAIYDNYIKQITALFRADGAEVGDASHDNVVLATQPSYHDPDDAPEVTKDFFDRAQIAVGDDVIRPAYGTLTGAPVDVIAALGRAMADAGINSIAVSRN